MGFYINKGNKGFRMVRNSEYVDKSELKFNRDADAAIDQIKRKQYPAKLEEYEGHLLLVGVNYDKETKTHCCKIEKH